MQLRRVQALVRACHPEPTLAVTGIATALAASVGARPGRVAAAFAAGQITTGWTNDWRDAERDRATGRSDKPVVRGDLSADDLARGAAVAAGLCVPLSLGMGRRAGAWHLVAVGSAATYNLGLKATPLSFLPYAVSFGLVPSIVTLGVGAWAPWWASAAGALLGVGAHLANALPDLDGDLATGVRGLPHRLGPAGSGALAGGLLLLATGVLALGPGQPGPADGLVLPLAAVVTAAGLLRSWQEDGSRAAFRAALLVAGLDVALLLARGDALLPRR